MVQTWFRSRWIVVLMALICLAMALGVAGAAGKGPLDGKTFVGETGEKGKPTGDKERFTFKDGVFDPLDCHQYGFTGAPYTSKVEGDAVRFEAETVSEKEGTMRWKGTVTGSSLEGTMVWQPKSGSPIDYWFRGTLQKAGS